VGSGQSRSDLGNLGNLFFKPDLAFATPKVVASLAVHVSRPAAMAGADRKAIAIERLMNVVAAKVVLEAINADSYAATLAGFTYEVSFEERGWYLEVHGFAHKLKLLLTTLCRGLHELSVTPCDELVLKRVLGQQQLALANAHFSPSNLATYERLRCLDEKTLTPQEMLDALDALTPASLTAHVAATLTRGVHCEAYIGGNVVATEAVDLLETAHAALGSPPALTRPPPLELCGALPAGMLARREVVGVNPADENCAVDIYWQLGADDSDVEASG